ncbi:baseplate J/gp47 family protein [Sedimentitalea arenosa]|uniref:Baseplate J/gp47 family protein n=1 Tax=Sedimentitalea arenosa TaxID=2798803 RepID=A0A8J7IH23_9RHOB|nr:baseplate J/gp47 family protein [Arenibacterium arenosum]MBJ6369932.1 baseplate J/gp47 family protein [Arenibacterium arenosum]
MTFVNRPYDQIVVDVLTTLTAGVAEESHRVSYDPNASPPQPVTVTLKKRPVSRVSMVRGFLPNPDPTGEPLPHVFRLDEYELVGGPEDPDDSSVLRFVRPDRRPAPDTDLSINYYPATSEPTPITDVNVGSVARTLVEAVSTEMAKLYAQLNLAYDSAFLETAQGAALDRVVALLAQKRARAGAAVGSVRFSRRAGAQGTITIPVGTPVTDIADTARYETVEPRQMLAGESVTEVRVRGTHAAVPAVEANVLTVTQRTIAGIDAVTNPRPTTRATTDESDDDLRRRVAGALLAANKGTVTALKNGLMALPDIRSVAVHEEPNGLPGEIEIALDIDGQSPGDPLPPVVANTIEDLRPAGIRVVTASAARAEVALRLTLLLAGAPQTEAVVAGILSDVTDVLETKVNATGLATRIRNGPLVAAVLADGRIADVKIALSLKGETGSQGADLTIEPQASVIVARSDIVFDPVAFEDAPADATGTQGTASLSLRAIPDAGATLQQAESAIRTAFEALVAALRPGDTLAHSAVLTALSGDFTLDPDSVIVTVQAGDLFAEVVSTGPPFTLPDGLALATGTVEVMA